MTEILFIDLRQNIFLPGNENVFYQLQYEGLIMFLLDGHVIHVPAWILASAGSERILVIRLGSRSSRLAQPLDLCFFRVFKIFYEKKIKHPK
jgi:hypothetical protein